MVTNEQVFLLIYIPVLWNALLWALGIAFMERRSAARGKRFNGRRNRRRA
jgi:hypothetical protein